MKTLALALLAPIASIAIAAPAHAGVATSFTVVDWGGSSCLEYVSANKFNPYARSNPYTQCDSGHELSWQEQAASGEILGIDPIMGDNDWISCSITINGSWTYTSYAARGDGHDVTCLRTVN